MSETIKAKPWVLVLVGFLVAAVLVALNQFGLIDLNGAEVTGATGAVVLVIRAVLALVTKAGWGWKSISAGVLLIVAGAAEVFGVALPSFLISAISMWATYALGDAVGLLKPQPK